MNNSKDSNNVAIFSSEQKKNPDQNYINKVHEERVKFEDRERAKLDRVIARHKKEKAKIARLERQRSQILSSERRESEDRDLNSAANVSELRDSDSEELNITNLCLEDELDVNTAPFSPLQDKTDFNTTFMQQILDRDSIQDSLNSFKPITPTNNDSILDLLECISPMSEPTRRILDFDTDFSPFAVTSAIDGIPGSKLEQISEDLLDFDTDSHSITKFQMLLNMSTSDEARNTLAQCAIEAELNDDSHTKPVLSAEEWEGKFRRDTSAKMLQLSQPVSNKVYEELIDLQMYCLERSDDMALLPRDASNEVKLKNHIFGHILQIIPYRTDPNKNSHF